MSAKDRPDSGNGRRDARDPRSAVLSPISEKLCSASAWTDLAQLAREACPACEREALVRAKRDAYEAIFALNERLRRSEEAHGATPAHAKTEVVIVVDDFTMIVDDEHVTPDREFKH